MNKKDKDRLDEFRKTLENNRFYEVKENTNYSKVLPMNMSYADLNELSERRRKLGEGSLISGSHIVHGPMLLS